jgi:VPDSG-CTERM motif
MMNKWLKMVAVATVVTGMVAVVHANPIVGSIGFTGNYTAVGVSGDDLSTATSMTIDSSGVSTSSGALLGATEISFIGSVGVNGNPPSPDGQQLFSVMALGHVYDFTISTSSETLSFGNTVLALGGTGSPTDDTAGIWNLSFNASGASFTWNSTTSSSGSVPDGGTTAMLLGAALSGMALLRRKLMA